MKRWGTITLMLFAFVVGFVSTYNCGGGSSSNAQSTQYLSVSFLGGADAWKWAPTDKTGNYWDPAIDEYDQFANADTSIQWSGRTAAYSASAGQKCAVYVPIQLPDGAVVVEFGMLYYDETDGDSQIKASLKQSIGDPKGMTIVSINPSGPSALPQYAWSTSINATRAVIDNTTYSYHIRGDLWGGENMVLFSAFVGYVMP